MSHRSSKILLATVVISLTCLLYLATTLASATPQTRPPASHAAALTNSHSFRVKKTGRVLLKNRLRPKIPARLALHQKKMKGLDDRRFSAMLPKGYVPPSDSSPCHNMYPNSVAFFCHLSAELQSR